MEAYTTYGMDFERTRKPENIEALRSKGCSAVSMNQKDLPKLEIRLASEGQNIDWAEISVLAPLTIYSEDISGPYFVSSRYLNGTCENLIPDLQ